MNSTLRDAARFAEVIRKASSGENPDAFPAKPFASRWSPIGAAPARARTICRGSRWACATGP